MNCCSRTPTLLVLLLLFHHHTLLEEYGGAEGGGGGESFQGAAVITDVGRPKVYRVSAPTEDGGQRVGGLAVAVGIRRMNSRRIICIGLLRCPSPPPTYLTHMR